MLITGNRSLSCYKLSKIKCAFSIDVCYTYEKDRSEAT